ncbi:amino acid deaminase [Microbacterium sp. Mu-80]|uniref:Amino acid deaminase n=1 Tax=Microbacterium bandirmense TaxID=3122050 RepID=A0ABU8LDN1_9MICO
MSHPAPAPDLTRVVEFVRADARADRFALWGSSTVVDENTGEPVIGQELFDALHDAAGITARYPVGNAGVIHVYGYWFSDVVTPYGRKRDRWQDGELAELLEVGPAAFHLTGGGSTPLQRVTEAALPHLVEPGPRTLARGDARVAGIDTRVVIVGAQARLSAALIYGIRSDDAWRIVTTFPLQGDPEGVVGEFLAEPRLRWNAAPSHGA